MIAPAPIASAASAQPDEHAPDHERDERHDAGAARPLRITGFIAERQGVAAAPDRLDQRVMAEGLSASRRRRIWTSTVRSSM